MSQQWFFRGYSNKTHAKIYPFVKGVSIYILALLKFSLLTVPPKYFLTGRGIMKLGHSLSDQLNMAALSTATREREYPQTYWNSFYGLL